MTNIAPITSLPTDLDRRAEKQVRKAVKSRPCLSSNVFVGVSLDDTTLCHPERSEGSV